MADEIAPTGGDDDGYSSERDDDLDSFGYGGSLQTLNEVNNMSLTHIVKLAFGAALAHAKTDGSKC